MSKRCRYNLSHVCKCCANIQKLKWKKDNWHKIYIPKQKKIDTRNDCLLKTAHILRKGVLKRGRNSKNFNWATIDFFYDLLTNNPKCQCCGLDFVYNLHNKHFNNLSPTIDRIDSSSDYCVENIGIICWKCNAIKSNANLDMLEKLLLWMKNVKSLQET